MQRNWIKSAYADLRQVGFFQTCVFHDSSLSSRLQILVAVHWDRDRLLIVFLLVRMMAPLGAHELPPVLLQDAAHPLAGDRFHNSITSTAAFGSLAWAA